MTTKTTKTTTYTWKIAGTAGGYEWASDADTAHASEDDALEAALAEWTDGDPDGLCVYVYEWETDEGCEPALVATHQHDLPEPTGEYEVENVEFGREHDDDPECAEQTYCEVAVDLRVTVGPDSTTERHYVSVMVGCPDWQLEELRASGSDVRPYADAWWTDSSDWSSLPDAEAAEVVLAAIAEDAYSLYRSAVESRPEPDKDDVSEWETAETYRTLDSEDESLAYEVEVQVGSATVAGRTAWFLRTRDDAGGSDDADDEGYASEADALAAAEAFAADRDETDGLDPWSWRERVLSDQAGEPDAEGEYCVYWATALDDEHVVARYATSDAAEAAATLANEQLHAAHPGGGLRCGYEVRRLDGDTWVSVDDDAA